MIISVASGKGGTGKTTVATNLAAALTEKVTFLDCDVEEPNAHLFLNPLIQKKEKIFTFVPDVDEELCNQCRKCVDICRFGALAVVGKRLLLFPELCHGCGGCVEVCDMQCFSEGKRKLGTIESGTRGNIDFHHGILRIGEAMSPPLIKRLRILHESESSVIIDAPPGTSCPVIAAMHGADYIVLVTEPTPFGLHDLKLAHQTAVHLGLPCGLVINRADLGDSGVQDYALKNSIPILLTIPFSRDIAETYSRGQLLVDQKDEWKVIFQNLFEEIKGYALLNEGRA